LLGFLTAFTAFAQTDPYALGPDSQIQPGVARGKVTQHVFANSKIYPGTVRDYWIYIPAKADASRPLPVTVFQDGGTDVKEDGAFRATVVMDNLIHKGEIPPMAAIFVNPGVLPGVNGATQQSRFNRSFEYDGLGDRYARFLIDELIPEVRKSVALSANPGDWALAGVSSGAIAAFNAAWMRNDAFHRVMSFIGSFTNLRGGHNLSTLVRKTEPKTLRVYLQDGSNDNNIYAGSWWMANQDLAASLEYAGYDYKFVTGTEQHNRKHGGAVLPDAMRWLWRDYGKPLAKAKPPANNHFHQFLDPSDSGWEVISQGHGYAEGTTVDKQGNVYFTDGRQNKIWKIDLNGKVSVFKEDANKTTALKFGPDGRFYGGQGANSRIVAIDMSGAETVLIEGVKVNDLTVNSKGEVYFTDTPGKCVWFLNAKGEKTKVAEGIESPNGIQLSPDQSLLVVSDSRNKWVWSYQVQSDGSLANAEPFYRLETPDDNSITSADGMTMDTDGFLYVTTNLGLQICDPPGRVMAILPKPQAGPFANVVFGGADFKTMYVGNGDKVYRRKMKRTGVTPWSVVKPPVPRL
jgi:sugar lactone lactonase YvrE/enterochelin esterase-like enzyme